jgi:hypothetical protein
MGYWDLTRTENGQPQRQTGQMGDGSRIADHVPQYLTTADGLAHGATTAGDGGRDHGSTAGAAVRRAAQGSADATTEARLAARRCGLTAGGAPWGEPEKRGRRRSMGRSGAGGALWGEAGLAARREVARVRRGEKRCAGKLGI